MPTEAASPAPVVQVEAPPVLRALLERHLDLVRMPGLAQGDAVTDAEWSRLADAAPAQVRELLQTEGYFDPQVQVLRDADPAGGPLPRTRIVVEPGARALVGRLQFEFEGELERTRVAGDASARALADDLRRGFALPTGAAFRNALWSEAKARALARLRAAGYAAANWSGTSAEVDTATQRVRLYLAADSGPLFRSGELRIEGLQRQDAQTVRNLAAFAPGTPVTEAMLLDFQERLQGSGLFDSATVSLQTDPSTAGAAPIVVSVLEAPLQVYTVGVGISANTGPRVSVEHVYRRVFGAAATARNKLEWGRDRQAWDGELSSHTRAGLQRNLLGGAVERLQTSSDVVLAQRLRLGRARDDPRREQLRFIEAERSVRSTATTRAESLALSLNQHVVRRMLDSVILPTEGYTLSLQGGLGSSHSTDASGGAFARMYGRLTAYRPLPAGWFGQARVELGQIVGPGRASVPEAQSFRAGGDDSVRGYAFRSLGPLDNGAVSGGRVLFTASGEVARPLSANLPALWGALFVDTGNAADSWGTLHPALGLGAGLRWRSPVGPLRVDWAWGRETRRARLHFSVGIAF